MTLSHAARERLLRLTRRCGRGGGGLRFLGAVGSCRGAVPLLEPDTQPRDGEETVEIEGVRFFVPAARRARRRIPARNIATDPPARKRRGS